MQFIDQKAIVYTDVRYFAESLHKKKTFGGLFYFNNDNASFGTSSFATSS